MAQARALRASAAFVAHMLSTPLGDVLAMKRTEFRKWRAAADEVATARGPYPA